MKITKAILGLPVICIEEGIEFGNVQGFIIDPDERYISYLLIDDGEWYKGAKILLYSDIIGIGNDAVTTKSMSNIHNFIDVKEAQDLAERGIKIANAKVYTQKGIYIGKVQEFYIDIDTGAIAGCQLDDREIDSVIPISKVVTFGKNVIIVDDDIEELISSMDQTTDFFDDIDGLYIDRLDDDFDLENNINNNNILKVGDNSQEEASDSGNKASSLFEERQRKFLLGRKASKDIFSDNGTMLVEVGQEITEDILDIIKENGKLTELTMNTQV